jgi:hypothetical protein
MEVKPASSWPGACNKQGIHQSQLQCTVVEYGLEVNGPWRFFTDRAVRCKLSNSLSLIQFNFWMLTWEHGAGLATQ